MPDDAPAVKATGTRSWGAEIVEYDRRDHDARNRIAAEIAAERGLILVPPFDDPDIIAGQGSLGLEIVEQAGELGVELDCIVTPAGGGGLASGVATAVKGLSAKTEIYTAEPEGFDDTARSLAAGCHQRNESDVGSICDALLAPQPGELTFAIMRKLVTAGLVISDDEARAAMRAAFLHLKVVAEPGGAAALAAVLNDKLDIRGKVVCVIMSGGNVDPSQFQSILSQSGKPV